MVFQYPLPPDEQRPNEELTSDQLQAGVDDAVDNCSTEDTSIGALASLMGQLGFVTGEDGRSDSGGSSEGIGQVIIFCRKTKGCLCGKGGCGDVLNWVGKGIESVLWGVAGEAMGGVGTCTTSS
ncbi:MAG: hypothetical protein M1836_003390 [Candelina mexicana]|nr:MAG: hypothetical protein M1836_003390 [Candelina mexicana]